MTGMVKEEILTRQVELGFTVQGGCIVFDFLLLDKNEFSGKPAEFAYRNLHGQPERMELPPGSIAYTICQVPVILQASERPGIEIHASDGGSRHIDGYVLDAMTSRQIFRRDGSVHHLVVSAMPAG
jgi:hypothetical protein